MSKSSISPPPKRRALEANANPYNPEYTAEVGRYLTEDLKRDLEDLEKDLMKFGKLNPSKLGKIDKLNFQLTTQQTSLNFAIRRSFLATNSIHDPEIKSQFYTEAAAAVKKVHSSAQQIHLTVKTGRIEILRQKLKDDGIEDDVKDEDLKPEHKILRDKIYDLGAEVKILQDRLHIRKPTSSKAAAAVAHPSAQSAFKGHQNSKSLA